MYGILGMTNAKHSGATSPDLSEDPFLLVNYNRSISQVYQDILYYYIEQGETLRIFFLLCIEGATFGGEAGNERLPTWCPNLSIPWGRAAGSITYDVTERMKSFSLHPRTPYRLSPIDRSSHIRHLPGLGIAEVVRNTGYRRRYWFWDLCGQSEDLFRWPYTWVEVSYAWLNSDLSLEFGKQKLGVDLKDVQKLARHKTRWATSGNEIELRDIAVAVEGSLQPFVLRPRQSSNIFEFVGLGMSCHFDTKLEYPSKQPEKLLLALQDLLIQAAATDLLQVSDFV